MYKVSDIEKAAKLYTEVLGVKQVWRDDKAKMIGLKLENSDTEIVLHSSENIPDFDFSYLVENVNEFIENARSKGFTLTLGPIEVRTGKYAVLEDPDHNKIPVIDLTKFGGVPRFD